MSPMLKALLASALTLPLVAFVGGVLAAPDDVDPDRSRPVIINRMDDDPSDGDTFAPTPTDEEPDGVTREPGDDQSRDDGSDDDQSRGGSPGGGGLTDDRSRPAAPPPPRDLDDDEDGGDDDSNDNSNGGGSGGSRDD